MLAGLPGPRQDRPHLLAVAHARGRTPPRTGVARVARLLQQGRLQLDRLVVSHDREGQRLARGQLADPRGDGGRADGLAVQGHDHITGPDAGPLGGQPGGRLHRHDARPGLELEPGRPRSSRGAIGTPRTPRRGKRSLADASCISKLMLMSSNETSLMEALLNWEADAGSQDGALARLHP